LVSVCKNAVSIVLKNIGEANQGWIAKGIGVILTIFNFKLKISDRICRSLCNCLLKGDFKFLFNFSETVLSAHIAPICLPGFGEEKDICPALAASTLATGSNGIGVSSHLREEKE
jgi:hypothetical protein